MSTLVAGIQYGLSSQHNFYENKSLIFVKLTDSAQRAIEDYLCNRDKINQNPTIQFLGSEGQLSFPSTKSSHGNFMFSLSNNQDIEGPQGGFECVQQIGPKNLESLGTLPCKMRIQANDDVYETTRHRMHAAEENNKNKCTRVIKGNEPIGRTVKVKGLIKTNPSISHSSSSIPLRHRESSRYPIYNIQSPKLSSFKSISTQISINRLPHDNQKKLPDIMRRPLKERLTHLLALRAFKRPELYDRINREGIREKEKSIVANVLKQIAFMRDNTYHLYRCMWNDVQEEWPFYTDQEKAMLKRRKPQNLTPPGSSDGSSGSGQSPNSTHPGSPPIVSVPSHGFISSKRPGYYQGNDGLPTKRQRISHYRKPASVISVSSEDTGRLNLTNDVLNSCDHTSEQLHHQQYDQEHSLNCISIKYDLLSTSDNEETVAVGTIALNKSTALTSSLSDNANCNMNMFLGDNNSQTLDEGQQLPETIEKKEKYSNEQNSNVNVLLNLNHLQEPIERKKKHKENYNIPEKEQCKSTKSSCSFNTCSSIKPTNFSDNRIIENNFLTFSASTCNRISPTSSEYIRNSEYSNYLTCYTKISSLEQRTRYKAEFNAYYKEYRKLHVQVVKISKQFSLLEGQLREKSESGNTEGYEAIKRQILQEYARTKNVNARFYYLHDKLGHIKKLVSDYDAQVHAASIIYKDTQTSSGTDFNINGLHRDNMENQCTFTHHPIDIVKRPIAPPPRRPQIS